jgi:hypothetical protein
MYRLEPEFLEAHQHHTRQIKQRRLLALKRRTLLAAAVIILILALLLAFAEVDLLSKNPATHMPDVYIGVDVGFGDKNDVKKVADAISGFANLIIIGSLDVTNDSATLTEVCDYLYQKGFSFIIYIGFSRNGLYPPQGPDTDFFNTTVRRWGDKFLGAYIFDEPGGKQLDYVPGSPHYVDRPVKQAENVSHAATQYIHILNGAITSYTGAAYYNVPNMKVFTSDYGLYWFDYRFGYNVVLGEFVGNMSKQLTIALCRGAANAQHMEWGTMITWKYTKAPFLADATEIYNDMVLAYENDAKYIVVFDSPDNQTATTDLGILTKDHVDAIEKFWNYASTHSRPGGDPAENAYVLPTDFGFGFRGPADTIWGLWPSNATAVKIWDDANRLIAQHGMNLDIVYEMLSNGDPVRLMYNQLTFWNGTIIGQSAN